jgi:ubiquinol-cytochrome c reductase iron-sulfur subunit
MAVLFIVAFIAIPRDAVVSIPYIGPVSALNAALGLTFGLAIFLIGAGAVHWAKKLMSPLEVQQPRHEMKADDEDTAVAADIYDVGKESSGFAKYPMIRRTLLAAMALVPLPFIVSLRDLWIQPADVSTPSALLKETIWEPGMRLVTDITYQPVKADTIPVGGLVNVVPANLLEVEEEEHNLNARAKAAAIVVRMTPEEIQSQQGDGWDYNGILCFSKICTHVGCPISLYQQRTHELLCPCHQSTFNLADSANVVFGPAARRMPQLPITVDEEGYLVAVSDFQEPVGPSFWELNPGGGNA